MQGMKFDPFNEIKQYFRGGIIMQVSNDPAAKRQNITAGTAKKQNSPNASKNQKGRNDFIVKGEIKAKQRDATEIVIKMESKDPKDENKKSHLEPVVKGEIEPGADKKEDERAKGTLEKWMEKHPSRFEAAKDGRGKMTHKPY